MFKGKKSFFVAAIFVTFLLVLSCFVGCKRDKISQDSPNNTEKNNGNVAATEGSTENMITEKPAEDTVIDENICLTPSEKALLWIENYNKKHGDGTAFETILDVEGIKAKNKKMESLADYLVDIREFTKSANISVETLKKWLGAEIPYNPCYKENGERYSQTEIDSIHKNRNIDVVGAFEIKRGVAVERADMRTVPFGEIVLKAADNMPYDRIQETEIITGMPLWVLHESLDGEYYYVQSYYYRGWVKKDTVAVTDNEDLWQYFIQPENFAVVTDTIVKIDGKSLDMGVVLPIEGETESAFVVTLPEKDSQGYLTKKRAELEKSKAHKGFVPYTAANYYTQAFKYIGKIYGWGGMNDSVDCSGFVCAVMRSFGFEMPRNTSQQCKIMCDPIDLKSLSKEDREKLFDELDVPAALFNPGHVRLVLGEIDGKYYIIHAPSAGKPVCVAEFGINDENLTYLSMIK